MGLNFSSKKIRITSEILAFRLNRAPSIGAFFVHQKQLVSQACNQDREKDLRSFDDGLLTIRGLAAYL